MILSSKKVVRNVISLGVVQAVNYIFPLITVPYVSRIIGPEGYGIINYTTAFIGYFTLIIAYGFDLTATRRISQNSDDLGYVNTVISEVLTSRIILFFFSLISFVVAINIFESIQKDKFVTTVLFIGSLATVISPQYIFQGLQELGIFARLNFIRGIINIGLVFLLIKSPGDYFLIPLLTTFFLISINLFLYLYAKRKFQIQYKIVKFKKALRLIKDERMIFFSTVVISLYTSTNTVVLGFFADTKDVGYYTTSHSFLGIVSSIISMPISTALYPFIGKAFSVSKESGLNAVKKITPIVFYVTFGASLLLLLLAPVLIKLIYGNKFDASIPALQIISFLPFVIGMSNIFGIQLMLNMGLDKMFFRSTLIASFIGIMLNIYMSKYYGYIGTAWNCLIVECVVTFLMYMALRRENINIFVVEYFKPKQILATIIYWNKN